MANNKKLTLSAVHKENSKFNEKTVVPLMDGKYEIIVNKYFKKTDIPKLIGEYMSINEQLKESGTNIDEYTDSIYLFHILIVKFMTNIPLPEDAVSLIAYIYELININLLSEIIEALPKEEVDKASGWIKEVLQKMPEVTPQIMEMIVNKMNAEQIVDVNDNSDNTVI